MTRKQELYRMLLEKGILIIRSQQSQLTFCPWWRVLPWKMHKLAREGYEVAQFLHQVPYLMAHEDFTEADLWFLNIHAHSFFTRIEPKTALLYTCFLSPMKQLFRLVPENMSEELKWLGPEPPPLTQKWQAELIAELFKANEISAAASCGVSERLQRQAAAGKWPLRRPLASDKQGDAASCGELTSRLD